MQIKIFNIPVCNSSDMETEANRFLRSHRILQVEKHFSENDGGYWTLLVSYMDTAETLPNANPAIRNREKEDPAKGLTDIQRKRFELFKSIRLSLAKENNMRAFMIFTDKELVAMSQIDDLTRTKMLEIKGIGENRVSLYGDYMIAGLNSVIIDDNEESGQSDASDM